MLAVNESVGRFVALANLEKDILSQQSIEQDVADLVDLITLRIKDNHISKVADGLLESIFKLRFDVLEWLVDNGKKTNDYFEFINERTAANLQLAPYSDLAKTVSYVLLNYEKITSPNIENFSKHIKKIRNGEKPEYQTLKELSRHPSPQIRSLKNWVDASLQLELGIILADLILTEQIQFPEARIEPELIAFLEDTIMQFGAYSIYTGYWKPDSKDVSNSTNSMQILWAKIQSDNGDPAYQTTIKGMYNLLNYHSNGTLQDFEFYTGNIEEKVDVEKIAKEQGVQKLDMNELNTMIEAADFQEDIDDSLTQLS